MKRIDRFNLIDRIARELQARMTYSDIDVYLGGFGVNTNKETSNANSKWVYSKELLADTKDDVLFNIAEELEVEHDYASPSEATSSESNFWSPSHFKLFLSHISEFKVKTSQLQNALRPYGITAFVAHEDIEPTKEWLTEIEKALFSMDSLVAILTPGFNDSKWTDQEVGVAVGRDILIVPVRKGLDPYGFIGKYQGMQGEGKTIGQVADAIFQILANHAKTKGKMAGSLVDLILLSNNIEDATEKLKLLRRIETLPERHLEKIRERATTNKLLTESESFVKALNEMLEEREMQPLTLAVEADEMFDDDIPF